MKLGDQNINSKGIEHYNPLKHKKLIKADGPLYVDFPEGFSFGGEHGDFEEEEEFEVHEDFYGEKMTTKRGIKIVTGQLRKVLTEKNKRYGDSALKPLKIFSKDNAKQGLYIRADDKLSRIKNSEKLRKNDVADLMGYCVLICMTNGWYDWSDLID